MIGRFGRMVLEGMRRGGFRSQGALVHAMKERDPTLNISQPILSNWVRVRPPKADDPRVKTLAEVLDIDVAALPAAIEADHDLESYVARDLEKFFVDAQALVGRVGRNEMDLWLFPPHSLPLLLERGVTNTWAENTRGGMNYIVVWPIDVVPEDTFSRFEARCLELDNLLEGYTGEARIRHIPIFLHSATPDRDAPTDPRIALNLARFDAMASRGFRMSVFHEFAPIGIEQRVVLASYMLSFGAVAAYVPHRPQHDAQVSVMLRGVSAKINGPTITPFFWLERALADRIAAVLQQLRPEVASLGLWKVSGDGDSLERLYAALNKLRARPLPAADAAHLAATIEQYLAHQSAHAPGPGSGRTKSRSGKEDR